MTTSKPRLSLCIATFNRAAFLRQMLESIAAQATDNIEIVVADNASTDDTEQVVATFARRFARLRYFKQESNQGLDRNFDRSIEIASGDYCWLLPDDDVLKPGAVAAVLQALLQDWALVLVNVDFMDFELSRVILRGVEFPSDRVYEPGEMDRLHIDAGNLNGYIGSFVIKRDVWLARDRARYFGSYFIHIGVIYQKQLPANALLIARPWINMRMGNSHEWWPRQFDIHMALPEMAQSLALSDEIKRKIRDLKPWKDLSHLLWLRAIGAYSLDEFRREIRPRVASFREMLAPLLVALIPMALWRMVLVLYVRVTRRTLFGRPPQWNLEVLRESRMQERNRPLRSSGGGQESTDPA